MSKWEFHFYTAFMNYWKNILDIESRDTTMLIGFKNDLEMLLAKVNKELRKRD